MAAQSLILCQDAQVLGVLQPVLAEMTVEASVCTSVSAAEAMLAVHTFDVIIADCEQVDGAVEFLEKVRYSTPAVELALAIVRGFEGMQQAFRAGADLVLWKPLSPEEAARVLRTARGLADRVRRRHSRVPVEALAYVNIATLREDAMITSISEGGLGIQGFNPLQAGRFLRLRFTLPGSTMEINADGEVAWADDAGQAGIRFSELSGAVHDEIKNWIAKQMDADARPPILPENPGPFPPLTPARTAQKVLAVAFDLVITTVATALFGLLFYVTTSIFPLNASTLLAAAGVLSVLWLTYRLVFFRDPARTPGARLAEPLCNWYLGSIRLEASFPADGK